MAFTDHTLSNGYVHPQDGSSSGIDDDNADWLNAVYLGAGYLAPGGDVAPFGYDVTADHTNEEATVGGGVAYIQVEDALNFREPDDSILFRSGEWNQPFVVFVYLSSSVTVPFETTEGTNYIWVSYDPSEQDNAFIRVADSESDEPSTPSLLIEEIDAVDESQAPQNRVAGYSWQYLGKQSTNGSVDEAVVNIPDNSFDEYKIKFLNVTGTAIDENTIMYGRANDHNANYWHRTTQNNTQQAGRYPVLQGTPAEMTINGHIYYCVDEEWTFDNRITTNHEEQYAYSGSNKSPADTTPLNSLQYFWSAGQIDAEFNIWARNRL